LVLVAVADTVVSLITQELMVVLVVGLVIWLTPLVLAYLVKETLGHQQTVAEQVVGLVMLALGPMVETEQHIQSREIQ
jgi:hypothetical protein